MAEPAHGCLATLHQFPAASALQLVQPVCVAVGAVQVASVQVAAQVHAAQAEHPTQYGESHVNTLHQPSQKVVWSKQFGEPTKPLHFLQSFWPHVYELHQPRQRVPPVFR